MLEKKVSQSLKAKGVQRIPRMSQAHITKYLLNRVRQSLMKYDLERATQAYLPRSTFSSPLPQAASKNTMRLTLGPVS